MLVMTHHHDVTIYYGVTVHHMNNTALEKLWHKGPRKQVQKYLQQYYHNSKKN